MPRSLRARSATGVIVVFVVTLIVGLVYGIVSSAREKARERELCEPGVAAREWRETAKKDLAPPERLKATMPIADALVGCDRPLVGLGLTEVRKLLGDPIGRPVDSATFKHWDVGSNPRYDSSNNFLTLRFSRGRVVTAEVVD